MTLTTRIVNWLRPAVVFRPRPATPRPAVSRRKAGRTVLTGLVAVLVAQLGLGLAGELFLRVKDPGYADKEVKLARLEAANPGAPRVLMLGTSRTGFAFHGGRVAQELAPDFGPVVAFNYGIPASGPVTHLVYTRRLLAEGHRPDLLLLEVLPPGLADMADGPLESRFMYGDRLRHSEVDAVIGYGFPAKKTREEWRGSVLNPWYQMRFPLLGRLMPSALPWHIRFDWSRSTDDNGWGGSFVETVTPQEYWAGLWRASLEYRGILAELSPGGPAARALHDLLALCREERIPVKLVLMPESEGFRALYPPAANARLYAFLRAACAEHGCELVDAREWLPDTAFTDGHHILRPAAEAFSDRLTREVIGPFLKERRR